VLIVGQSRPGRVYPIAHATSCRLRKRQIQLERARVRKRIDRLTKAVSGVLVVIGCALTDICVRGCDAFAKLRCQSWREPELVKANGRVMPMGIVISRYPGAVWTVMVCHLEHLWCPERE
jgi:hypothetical protein